ncbi:NO-associated protein 1, chloroplastic/mitochondrial [Sesamum angolense]|uniref:NO-associated protein 1, chloroplastic/mitochondrial n=1 Tax=Sesamum angolense TaxID=2727404 RepID=A0AAE1W1S8_9LAMI|nr:NO-associated protein 1, chloroplastic/mitochondrial [Sesamum angolense]
MALAPKPLSLSSLSAFRRPYSFQNPYPKPFPSKFNCQKPLTFIICKSTQTDAPNSSFSTPESDGSGPSAPTRGDLFLQRHQSSAASATVLAEIKEKKKKNKQKAAKASSFTVPSCYGCGAPLQTSEADAPGYVEVETYNLKKKHRQLRTVLCGRCRLLSHGHMITAVGGNGGYSGGKQFVTAEELREKLSHLRHEKALVVKLVDVVDFNGSFLARVRDLAGANPIILVVTKVDLLPKGTDLNCVGDWVVEATVKKKLNVLSVHLTSSKSLVGVAGVISEIQKEKKVGCSLMQLPLASHLRFEVTWKFTVEPENIEATNKHANAAELPVDKCCIGRDVYILGSANVGKSAFINALLSKLLSILSVVSSIIEKLYDTPGVHLHHRQAAVIHSEDLPALAPQSRLRGQPFPNPHLILDNSMVDQIKSNGLVGFSIFWGGLVRIDVIKVLPETRLTFYGPKALQIHMVPTEEAEKFYEKEVGIILTISTGKQKTETWMGLETKRELQLKYDDIH